MPQASVLGPLLFSLGKHKGINFHFYADDTQLYVHLSHMNTSAAFDKSKLILHRFDKSKLILHRLQSIQKSAARIVINSSKYTWITPVLRKLHIYAKAYPS